MVCVLGECQSVGGLVAVFVDSCHAHLDLCFESCPSGNKPLANASGEEVCGRWWNWAYRSAGVDDVVYGDPDGAKVVWDVPVDHWKWHRVEAFVVSWVRNGSAVSLCVGGSTLLVVCIQVHVVQVLPRCFHSGGPKDGLEVVVVWLQLVDVVRLVVWKGENGLS